MTDRHVALVAEYLAALGTSDADRVVALFAAGGVVHSPLYGVLPAVEFYPALFADTADSVLTLNAVMAGHDTSGAETVSFWFRFDWTLRSGRAVPFDVVDVATLDDDGRIASLRIVYDTAAVRPAFEADTGRASARPSD